MNLFKLSEHAGHFHTYRESLLIICHEVFVRFVVEEQNSGINTILAKSIGNLECPVFPVGNYIHV